MPGPDNAIVGDLDESISLPRGVLPEADLTAEKNRARYSKTKEFKEIKAYWEARIKFFETYVPSGVEIRWQVPDKNVAQQWILANNMINEIRVFLNQYEIAREIVENARRADPKMV